MGLCTAEFLKVQTLGKDKEWGKLFWDSSLNIFHGKVPVGQTVGLTMKNRIWEVPAFRMTIELDKLARDEKKIKKVFEILEECRIPCECMALNIDSLSTAVRKSEQGKIEGFGRLLKGQLGQVDIVTEDGVALLCVESELLKGRKIGMIVSSLSMEDIEIKMQRYLRYKNLLMVCVALDKVERAKRIIIEALDCT